MTDVKVRDHPREIQETYHGKKNHFDYILYIKSIPPFNFNY